MKNKIFVGNVVKIKGKNNKLSTAIFVVTKKDFVGTQPYSSITCIKDGSDGWTKGMQNCYYDKDLIIIDNYISFAPKNLPKV